jgi:hypothetical protein
MIAAFPEVIQAGTQKNNMTWIADIAPTLLEAAGGDADEWTFDGISQWMNWTGGNTRSINMPLVRSQIAIFLIIKRETFQFVRFGMTDIP